MKIAKLFYLLFFGSIVTTLSFSACSLDEEGQGTEVIKYDFVTIDNPDNKTALYHMVLEDGTRLYVSETDVLSTSGTPKDGSWVLAGYVELGNNNIRVKTIAKAVLEEITDNRDGLRNDDGHRFQVMKAGGKDYLGVSLLYYTSTSNDYKHKVFLVKKEYESDAAYFDLIYSNGGDAAGSIYSLMPVCFDLSPLKTIYQDGVNLVIYSYEEGADKPVAHKFNYTWKEE